MPAAAPALALPQKTELLALGLALRERRLALGVSTVAASQAAGMSRVTLHRIERGEPSVAVGALMALCAALGLPLALGRAADGPAPKPAKAAAHAAAPAAEATVRLADYPQLQQLAWSLGEATTITQAQALSLYERQWRHVDVNAMAAPERQFLQHLVQQHGGGKLLV